MKIRVLLSTIVIVFSIVGSLNAQVNQGLVFNNPQLLSGSNLQKDAVYLFKGIRPGVNAKLKIADLIGGAEVKKIDDNSDGVGYLNAWQPEIGIPSGTGNPYALFTMTFVDSITGANTILSNVIATGVDIDGNLNLKEMVEVDMGGGNVSFLSSTLDISVIQLLWGKFKGENILGIERTGIDTTALGNMFTVTHTNISSLTFRIGASTLLAGSANRQYSLYMKGFNYMATLPIKFHTFSATLNKSKADLKWSTASEVNVSHFVVEKSMDGINFSDAGIVFAYGNSVDQTDYTYSDIVITSKPSIIYYRIRSVDNDSKNQYSVIRIIRIDDEQAEKLITILTYPNPATNELRITIPGNWQNKKVTYELFSVNGITAKKSVTAASGQTEVLDISNLAKGFYIVKVTCGEERAQQKIIKN